MLQSLCTRFTWLSLLLIATAGCSRSGTTPVRGVVKLDGKALAGASVLFIAQDDGGRDARGATDAEGVFRLSTFQPNDGAFPGKYKVVVQPASPTNSGPPAASPQEAQRASNGSIPERSAVTVPAKYSQPDQTILLQQIPVAGDVVLELQSK
jgi:hypothetical protein